MLKINNIEFQNRTSWRVTKTEYENKNKQNTIRYPYRKWYKNNNTVHSHISIVLVRININPLSTRTHVISRGTMTLYVYVKIIISHGERALISQFLQLDSITGTRPIMVIIDFDNPRRLNLGNLCELSGIKWDGKSKKSKCIELQLIVT